MKASQPPRINPCPFCLSRKVQLQTSGKKLSPAFIQCMDCHARSRLYPDVSEAILAWNRTPGTS
ncbi:Lar family restriction alleviation protein [Oxalobacter vibrioformis]|uniref:Lar family restriction alleviation protein n=1 Tax=Oxalobacter vibrioformis TaxID=933080 RepID=UPI0038CD72F7